MNDWKISIAIEAPSIEEAAAILKQELRAIEASDWNEKAMGSGGGGGPSVTIYIGPRPLSVEERLRRLEGGLT